MRFLILLLIFSINSWAQTNEYKDFVRVLKIRGVNYYPQLSPWDTFGESFDANIFHEDFALIRNMGLNTIRIFIQYEDFNDETNIEEKINRLNTVMKIASKEGLQVMVTLFDFYGSYDKASLTENKKYLFRVVESLKNHANLLAWDIKNEPDLDFNSQGKETVIRWLKLIIEHLRKLDKRHPITIGWSNPESAINLLNQVDFVSFHYYRDLKNLPQDYMTLSNRSNKPMVLQEFGFSSFSGFLNFFSSSEKKQANYFKKASEILKEHSIPHLFWTLYDFEEIPDQVVGKKTRHQKKQMRFGIIGVNRNKKKAYRYLNHNLGLSNN
ncbi:cellulase family glycosylhydrolase [Croceivirga thetidis]|uniref:mannan endo-1,4-beta-mannosidase n=1 Tax=Croceivirga thetidis TaxID=2721623 RepID=A0ABX1GLD5_9FLAO|nr:cellulase family glycosylhydrolase [Croceivirga thetidis]NKI30712.1 cellulase family glycosylhydrolase [Croceivirga thetidis]